MRGARRYDAGWTRALALGIAAGAIGACAASSVEPVREPALPAVTAVSSAPAIAAAAPSATASAAPVATPAPAPAQGKCGPGMVEYGGGKIKSSYYRKEMAVGPFCVDVDLTTAEQYAACVAAGKCDKSATHACDPSTIGVPDRGNMPMVCVDFAQSERYCKAQGKRLVTDLEWEWAARGAAGRLYPWGNDAPSDQLCWSGKEKRATPCLIGATKGGANPEGVQDLAGNVNQWTTTTNDASSTFRGGRGGSWKDDKADLVSATHRNGFKDTYRCGFLGIRCATDAPK